MNAAPPFVPSYASPSSLPYESARPRARALLVLLLIGLLADLVGGTSDLEEIRLLSRAVAGQQITQKEAAAHDSRAALIGVAQIAIFLATAIVFLTWAHRTYRNLSALSAPEPRFTPRWAVACYFIPILNLFRPFQIMRETWNGSASETQDVSSQATPPLIGWWWALWLISGGLGRAAYRLARRAEDAQQLLTSAYVSLIHNGVEIILTIVVIVLVRTLTDRQDETAAQAGAVEYAVAYAPQSSGMPWQ